MKKKIVKKSNLAINSASAAEFFFNVTNSLVFPSGREELLSLVHLESSTGEVVVASKIDHELYPWINLTVKGVDSGVPPRYSIVDLIIQVIGYLFHCGF